MVYFKSLFILWITGPRSSVRLSLTRAWWLSAPGMWRSSSRPGRGGRQWLGSLPRHSAGVGISHSHCQVTRSTAILAHSIPSPSSHDSAMARTGRKSIPYSHQTKKDYGIPSTVCLPWISTRPLRPKHPDSGRRSLLRLTLYSPHRRHLGRPRWVPHRPHTKAHIYPTLVPCGAHMGPILVPTGLPHLGPRWGHATKPM